MSIYDFIASMNHFGAKYLVFVSSCSLKTRELSFAQFCNFTISSGSKVGKDKSPEVPFHEITSPYGYFEVI